jgi:hypothetical protein
VIGEVNLFQMGRSLGQSALVCQENGHPIMLGMFVFAGIGQWWRKKNETAMTAFS